MSALIGLLLTVLFYAALIPLDDSRIAEMFTRRGFVPYFITFFTAWCLSILFFKWRKLSFQRQSLGITVVPTDHDFVLSSATVDIVLDRTLEQVDDPRQFVLFNRITVALSNLRNLGRVADVDTILRSQAEVDESSMETSYSLLAGFIWAIPVLGFIGTVIGLSNAIGGFGAVLETAADIESIKGALQNVTGGLATAFETTLEALLAALIIQLIVTFLKKAEQEFLDDCSDYCSHNIVNKLRIMPFQSDSSE